jgi:mRNA interferase YafQ
MATAEPPPPRGVVTSKAFERDVKRLRKRGKDMGRLRAVIEALRLRQPLAARHRDHALSGYWEGFRDCHVEGDWVLVYRLDEESVYLTRTGTHADLFE